jgi:hypothetical protein
LSSSLKTSKMVPSWELPSVSYSKVEVNFRFALANGITSSNTGLRQSAEGFNARVFTIAAE